MNLKLLFINYHTFYCDIIFILIYLNNYKNTIYHIHSRMDRK